VFYAFQIPPLIENLILRSGKENFEPILIKAFDKTPDMLFHTPQRRPYDFQNADSQRQFKHTPGISCVPVC